MKSSNMERLCATILAVAMCNYRSDCIVGVAIAWFIVMCCIDAGDKK